MHQSIAAVSMPLLGKSRVFCSCLNPSHLKFYLNEKAAKRLVLGKRLKERKG